MIWYTERRTLERAACSIWQCVLRCCEELKTQNTSYTYIYIASAGRNVYIYILVWSLLSVSVFISVSFSRWSRFLSLRDSRPLRCLLCWLVSLSMFLLAGSELTSWGVFICAPRKSRLLGCRAPGIYPARRNFPNGYNPPLRVVLSLTFASPLHCARRRRHLIKLQRCCAHTLHTVHVAERYATSNCSYTIDAALTYTPFRRASNVTPHGPKFGRVETQRGGTATGSKFNFIIGPTATLRPPNLRVEQCRFVEMLVLARTYVCQTLFHWHTRYIFRRIIPDTSRS